MSAYSRYQESLKRAYEKRRRHFLKIARASVAEELGKRLAIDNLEITSTIKGVRGRPAGRIIGKVSKMSDNMNRDFEPITEKYSKLILAESQKLVPIDKKYIGKFNIEDPSLYKVKRETVYDIPIGTYKDVKGYVSMDAFYDAKRTYDYDFTLSKGMYFGEQAEFIKTFLKNQNKRKIYQLYQDPKTRELHSASARYGDEKSYNFKLSDIQPARGTTKQLSGGNQELKKSGRIEKTAFDEYRIVYDAFSVSGRTGKKFHYAQVQHDNLAYKHTVGGPLFVYKAFDKYRESYKNEIEKAVQKNVKEFNNAKT